MVENEGLIAPLDKDQAKSPQNLKISDSDKDNYEDNMLEKEKVDYDLVKNISNTVDFKQTETVMKAIVVGSSAKQNLKVIEKVLEDEVEVSKMDVDVSRPVASRPSRLRKTVEHFIDTSVEEKEPTKKFTVEKGRGTPLKDIPIVV